MIDCPAAGVLITGPRFAHLGAGRCRVCVARCGVGDGVPRERVQKSFQRWAVNHRSNRSRAPGLPRRRSDVGGTPPCETRELRRCDSGHGSTVSINLSNPVETERPMVNLPSGRATHHDCKHEYPRLAEPYERQSRTPSGVRRRLKLWTLTRTQHHSRSQRQRWTVSLSLLRRPWTGRGCRERHRPAPDR